jgi:hypothetical protein
MDSQKTRLGRPPEAGDFGRQLSEAAASTEGYLDHITMLRDGCPQAGAEALNSGTSVSAVTGVVPSFTTPFVP